MWVLQVEFLLWVVFSYIFSIHWLSCLGTLSCRFQRQGSLGIRHLVREADEMFSLTYCIQVANTVLVIFVWHLKIVTQHARNPWYNFHLHSVGKKYGFGTAPLRHSSNWSFVPWVVVKKRWPFCIAKIFCLYSRPKFSIKALSPGTKRGRFP